MDIRRSLYVVSKIDKAIMSTTLNESELKVLLEELIKNRKSVNDGICPSCHDIHHDGGNCRCDDDE